MTSEARRVLVTGGAGFIASHVADAYLAQGDRVWIVDDLSSGKRANLPSHAEFVEMDVRDPEIRNLDYGMDFAKFRRIWRFYLIWMASNSASCDGEINGNAQYLLVHA